MADWYFRNRQSGLIACPGCRNLVRGDEEFCPYCAKRLGPEKGIAGWFRRLSARQGSATRALIALIVFFFFLQLITDVIIPDGIRNKTDGGDGGFFGLFVSLMTSNNATYILLGSNFHPYAYYFGQVWRFLTACFLHMGIFHIVFNCWAFWDLGRLAEKLWGAKQVFATFIITGIAGSALSFAWNFLILLQGLHWTSRPVNSLGASGAICGILGLLLGSYYRNKYHIGEMLGSHLIRWAVYIFAFGLALSADNAAHLGGLASGAVLGYFLVPAQNSKNYARDNLIWNILAVVSLLIMLTCFVFMAVFYVTNFNNPFKL